MIDDLQDLWQYTGSTLSLGTLIHSGVTTVTNNPPSMYLTSACCKLLLPQREGKMLVQRTRLQEKRVKIHLLSRCSLRLAMLSLLTGKMIVS